jgi:transcriptional regulator with XRE-family HTH domain
MAEINKEKTFLDRLKAALARKGQDYYSPTSVGEFFGVNKQTAARWLAGGEPNVSMLFVIADKLEVSPRWLAVNEGPMSSTQITDEESAMVEQIYRQLSGKARAKWLRDGHELVELTTPKGVHNPFRKIES